MKVLEDRILSGGTVGKSNILKVDNFLNHQIDVPFISILAKELYERFKTCAINKILTVESSGIGIACITAQFFNCPVVFAKKSKSKVLEDDFYSASAFSFTHGNRNDLIVRQKFLSQTDRILIIDDFLANGEALKALLDIAGQAGSTVCGAGIIIEKAFQKGGDEIRSRGVRVESLARVASMDEHGITFIPDGK